MHSVIKQPIARSVHEYICNMPSVLINPVNIAAAFWNDVALKNTHVNVAKEKHAIAAIDLLTIEFALVFSCLQKIYVQPKQCR